eukprot:793406-Amphidinium_carterae.1
MYGYAFFCERCLNCIECEPGTLHLVTVEIIWVTLIEVCPSGQDVGLCCAFNSAHMYVLLVGCSTCTRLDSIASALVHPAVSAICSLSSCSNSES